MNGLEMLGADDLYEHIGVAPSAKPVVSRLAAAAKRSGNAASKLQRLNPKAAQALKKLAATATAKGAKLQQFVAKVAARGAAPVSAKSAVHAPAARATVTRHPTAIPTRRTAATSPAARGRASARVGAHASDVMPTLTTNITNMLDVYDAFAQQLDDAGIAGEVIALVQQFLPQLQNAGQTSLINTGNNLVLQANNIISNVQPPADPTDSSSVGYGDINQDYATQSGNDLRNQAEEWARQARAAIAAAPNGPAASAPGPGAAPAVGPVVQGAQWTPNTSYGAGSSVINSGNTYTTSSGGTSGAGPGPVAMQNVPIQDGTVQWTYLSSQQQPAGGAYGGGGGSGGGGSGGGSSADAGGDDQYDDAYGPGASSEDDGGDGADQADQAYQADQGVDSSGDDQESDDASDSVSDGVDDNSPEANDSDVGGFNLIGGGGGGHHGGGHHGGHGGHRGGGWYGPWGYDGLELLDIADDEIDVDDVVNAVVQRIKERKKTGTVIGAYDLGQATKQMDALKQVPLGIAEILVRRGQTAINTALSNAKQPWYKFDLPGETARKNVQGHLQWHADALAKLTGNPQTTMYDSAADLKHWVLQAYVEQNAAEEGAATDVLGKAWGDYEDMWAEIGRFIATLPTKIIQAVGGAIKTGIEAITGIPMWAFWAGGGLILVLLGFGTYKLLKGPAGQVVMKRLSR